MTLSVTLFGATVHSKDPKKDSKKASESSSPSAQRYLRSLSLRDKVAQLVIMPIYGEPANVRSATFRKYTRYIQSLHVGGVIVVGRTQNGVVRLGEPYALAALLNRLQKMSRLPLLVAADFERGASMRVNSTTLWPYNMAFAAAHDLNDATYEGAETARDARTMGVNWIFAPVADVNNNPENPIINIRSYGENPDEVSGFVQAFINGAHSDPKNPILVTVKHFPGHGDTSEDSHVGLPRLDATLDRINSVELKPFRAAVAVGVDSVMTAHLAVPALDPGNEPATVSSKILTDLLRADMNFHGIIITDAMDMQGLTNMFNTSEAAVRAILAGSDVLLMPTHAEEAINGILAAVASGRISRRRIDESVARVLAAKVRLGLMKKRSVSLEAIADIVDSPEATERAQQVADRAVTLVKDDKDNLPLRYPESTCLIALSENRRGQQGQQLIEEVKKRAPAMTTTLLDAAMSKADLEQAAAKTATCSRIVVAAYVSVAAYRGNVALAGNYPAFVNSLIATNIPLTLASLGSPYLVSSFPNVSAYLATYSSTPTSELALVKALFGEIPISGHLPVTIPGIAPYGAGIELPALPSKGF